MSLTRQEVFQALADGKEVKLASAYSDKYQPLDSFSNFLNLNAFNFNMFVWRIKPEPPKWYENIPSHGVLCWVHDTIEHPNSSNSGLVIIKNLVRVIMKTLYVGIGSTPHH
jgi:hypothetical protein